MENNDPVGELLWLIETLAAAEAAGEAVHILGHIPPGAGDCDHIWSHVFSQIIARCVSLTEFLSFMILTNHLVYWWVTDSSKLKTVSCNSKLYILNNLWLPFQ